MLSKISGPAILVCDRHYPSSSFRRKPTAARGKFAPGR